MKMAISKSSIRHQFTLNTKKEKESIIANFLDTALNPNSTIKEILYNHIVSNYDTRLIKDSNYIVSEGNTKSLTMSKTNHEEDKKESNFETKSYELSEIELNEIEELSKFV